MKALVSTLICSMVLLAGRTAYADGMPSGCSNAYLMKAYQAGIPQGKSLVQRAWQRASSCDKLETFSDIVMQDVKPYAPRGATEYGICRYAGLYDGILQELDSVWTACDGQCCDKGRVIGELAADLYCQLSILLGGLGAPGQYVRQPVYLCGFSFQLCCDAEFVSTSVVYQDSDSSGQPKECRPYTEEPYTDVWNGTRELQCTYTPPPPF